MQFEAELKKLNKAQREAVDTIEGPVMVVAGPGTGKTQVLTLRIANIIKQTDTPPESILALTFTESAVAAMRKRLVEVMSVSTRSTARRDVGGEAYRVSIKTIHGFCNDIIQDYPEEFAAIAGATNITEVEQIDLMRELLDAGEYELLRPFGDPYRNIRDILGAIGDLKQEGVLPEDFGKIVKAEQKQFDLIEDLYHEPGSRWDRNKSTNPVRSRARAQGASPSDRGAATSNGMKGKYQTLQKQIAKHAEIAQIYEAYQKELRKRKAYDYDDMVVEVAKHLEANESLLLTLQEKYLYVLVDEHQDTNSSQNKVIELLASYDENPNLFVVGDEKQAIYRFQGASVENFTYFQKKFKRAKIIALTENYRSHQTILDAAVDVALGKGPLNANVSHKTKPIQLVALSQPDVEQYFIASNIKEKIEKGVAPEEIAVLYRTNSDAAVIARILEKMGVPFTVQSDEDVLEDDDMKKALRLLEAVRDFGHDYALIPALYIDFLGIAPLDVALLLEAARVQRSKVFPLVRDPKILERIIPYSGRKVFELYQKLSLWKAMSKNRNPVEVFEAIVRDSGLLSYLLKLSNAQEKLAKLHALFDELKSLVRSKHKTTLEDFLNHLEIIREHRIRIKAKIAGAKPSAVSLMTAHRAKGLEFEYVYIIGATLGHWGSRRNRDFVKLPEAIYFKTPTMQMSDEESGESDADERNLFYVALTRAKKEAYITYAQKNIDGKDQLVSEFVASIRPELIEQVKTEKIEAAFAAHRDIEFVAAPQPEKSKADAAYQEFLQKRFKEKGLSVSALNTYLRCPQQFLLVHLVGIPEAPSKFLQYGNAVHAALKFLSDRRKEGVTKAQVSKVFQNALKREPINERDLTDLLKKGEKALGSYYDRNYKTCFVPRSLGGGGAENSLAEQSVYGVQIGDLPAMPAHAGQAGVELKGKIDRIDINEDGTATVIDYKTGKVKSRNEIAGVTKDAEGDYYRQLVFYKLLLEKSGKYQVKEGAIDFVEADAKGKFHKEIFAPSDKEAAELEEQIKEVAKNILDGKFTGCGEKDCQYCGLA